MAIICAASFAGVFSCLYLVPEQDSYYIWPCMAACIVTNTGGIHLASYLADGLHADLERKNLQLMNHYYQELENSQNQIRRLRHDMNSHLSGTGIPCRAFGACLYCRAQVLSKQHCQCRAECPVQPDAGRGN